MTIKAIEFGFKPNDKSFDNTLVWNELVKQGEVKIEFSPGQYHFLTKPNAVTNGINIKGHSMSSTTLVKNYVGNEPFIEINFVMGCKVSDIGIYNTVPGGVGLQLKALDNNTSPDYSTLRNLYISGSSPWTVSLDLDGQKRNSGLRDLYVENVHVFASTVRAVRAIKLINFKFIGSIFEAGGSNNSFEISNCKYGNVLLGYHGKIETNNNSKVHIQGLDMTRFQKVKQFILGKF